MILEKDLQEAIAECQGIRNPSANTCIKLAAYYIIQEHMYGSEPKEEDQGYSFAAKPPPNDQYIDYDSNTEFGQLIHGREQSKVWPVIDEAIDALQVLNPRMYSNILRKIGE